MAKYGEAVTYAMGEEWCWDATQEVTCDYNITWAKEFRYDGARQRYAVYDLNTAWLESETISINSATRTDYNGDGAYLDFQSGVGTLRQFEPGIAMIDSDTTEGDADTLYYHTDHLGTTRLMSDSSGYAATGWHSVGDQTDVKPSVYSAFGEHLSVSDPFDGAANRYGYVGAHGYQSHDPSEMPFLHVGHRYYDPRSGRFLQRDPIGILAGYGVYHYVHNQPTSWSDPSGLDRWLMDDEWPHRYNVLGCDSMGYYRIDYSAKWWGTGWISSSLSAAASLVSGVPGVVVVSRTTRPPGSPHRSTSTLRDYADIQNARSGGWYHGLCHNCRDFSGNVHRSGKRKPPLFGPGPNVPCFPAGTVVGTIDGLVNIEEVDVGNSVLTYDFQDKHVMESKVIASGPTGFVSILAEVSIGKVTIRSTVDHPYWVHDVGWVHGSQLQAGYKLLTASGALVEVTGVRLIRLENPIPVYDIRVVGHHWFFVSELQVLVHNT